jgi:hypothetical protein
MLDTATYSFLHGKVILAAGFFPPFHCCQKGWQNRLKSDRNVKENLLLASGNQFD